MKTTIESLPPAQVDFIKHCLEHTPGFITKAVNRLMKELGDDATEITPYLLLEWADIGANSTPEGANIGQAIEPRVIIEVARRAGYTIEEICIFLSPYGRNKDTRSAAIGSLTMLIAAVDDESGGKIRKGETTSQP